MPNYKMVDADALDGAMLETAKAIREKGGTEELIAWNKSTGYKEAIEAITGGGGLNFEVVGGTTRPENPAENTIWVSTGTEIEGWSFSQTEPSEPADGFVWFVMTSTSLFSFNALSENEIVVHVLGAYQYMSGEKTSAPIQIYKNGNWALPFENPLVDGIPTTAFLAAGTTVIRNPSSYGLGLVFNASELCMTVEGGGTGAFKTNKLFDVRGASTITVTGTTQAASYTGANVQTANLTVSLVSGATGDTVASATFSASVKGTVEDFSIKIDLLSANEELLDDECYLMYSFDRGNSNFKATTTFENILFG